MFYLGRKYSVRFDPRLTVTGQALAEMLKHETMKLVKNFNYILLITIVTIAIYLWTIYTNINYNPNHIPVSHHDYGISGFVILACYTIAWIIFIVGLLQLKCYLLGKDRIYLIVFIYGAIISYTLFLLFQPIQLFFEPIDLKIFRSGSFKKSLVLVIPSTLILIFTTTKYARAIHYKNKIQSFENTKKKWENKSTAANRNCWFLGD